MIKFRKKGYRFLTKYLWMYEIYIEVYSVHGDSFCACSICDGRIMESESTNINDATNLLIREMIDHLTK